MEEQNQEVLGESGLTAPEEVDESVEDTIDSMLADRRSQPVYIDDLPDAIGTDEQGVPMLILGKDSLIVIERWYKNRWLGTRLYKVLIVNPITGDIRMHDEEYKQSAQTNYLTAPKSGWRFKQPVPGLNLYKRSKPSYEAPKVVASKVQPVDDDGNPVEKKRGRPKGSKNRSAEEMAKYRSEQFAEKKAKREAREARKLRRGA